MIASSPSIKASSLATTASVDTERKELARIGREIKLAFRSEIPVTAALAKLESLRISRSMSQLSRDVSGLCYRICEIPKNLRSAKDLVYISQFIQRMHDERLLVLAECDAQAMEKFFLQALESNLAINASLDLFTKFETMFDM